MFLWIIFAVLTVLVTAVVITPLFGNARKSNPDDSEFDKEVYKARIVEIERDLELGRISASEADGAKAEEARRLIKVTGTGSKKNLKKSTAFAKLATIILVAFIPLFTIGLYILNGSPNLPDQSLAKRQDIDPTKQTLSSLLQKAEAQLAKNPEDGNGWDVVAPVYMRLGRYSDAVLALRNSIRVNGANYQRMSLLAEALVAKDQGIVNEEAQKIFVQASEINPSDPKPKFFLAIALGQSGQTNKAISAWRALLKNAPANAEWSRIANFQLNEQLKKQGKSPEDLLAKDTLSGPTKEDIANASELAPKDRQEMIEGMVASLAEKLEDEPRNTEGWKRLIRSYIVLGRPKDALTAIESASSANGDDQDFMAHLKSIEEQISEGLSGEDQ